MKKIIDGKLYDTATAKRIGSYDYSCPGDFVYFYETLYQKKTGELFLYHEASPRSRYAEPCEANPLCYGSIIMPECSFDVKTWVSWYCDVDTYIRLFGPVEE